MTPCISQTTFSFYSHRRVRVDFCGGQISSDAGLLTLRAFDERHHLTADLAEPLRDARDPARVSRAMSRPVTEFSSRDRVGCEASSWPSGLSATICRMGS